MSYCIKIEIVTCDKDKCVFEFESNALHKLNFLGIPVESPDAICHICIFRNLLILKTEDRVFRNGHHPVTFVNDDRSENNVLAYDLHGRYMWNIGEIVGDIRRPFTNISCVFKEDAEKEYGITIPDGSDILLECVAGGLVYIVDAINKKLLKKIAGRVK